MIKKPSKKSYVTESKKVPASENIQLKQDNIKSIRVKYIIP